MSSPKQSAKRAAPIIGDADVRSQLNFFTPSYADIPIRDQRDTMERPFFSLAKKPRKTPINYEVGNVTVKVYPVAEFGIATIWDADILIWATTQITEALDRGVPAGPRIEFHPYNLLKGIRRPIGGDHYDRLEAGLHRLASTYVVTNIRVPKDSRLKTTGFHWIEKWDSHKDADGKPTGMSITLPDWLYQGIIEGGGVLSIHEDYFLLTGGIERGGWPNSDIAISGTLCLNTAPLVLTRSENDEANTTDAQRDFEGESGSGCVEGREDAGRVGATI